MNLHRWLRRSHSRLLPQDVVDQLSTSLGPWLSCDDCFDRCDIEIEAFLSAQETLPADFLAHVRTCPACCHEARTLLALTATDELIDPARATARFDALVGSGRNENA